MIVRVVVVVALFTVSVPIAAQDQSIPVAPTVVAAGAMRSSTAAPVRFTIAPDWARLQAPVTRARFVTTSAQAAAAPRKRSKAPLVGAIVLGTALGFLGGNYLQHSVCEYDCPPGGFTWGFTAIGAGSGAAIGWLIWK